MLRPVAYLAFALALGALAGWLLGGVVIGALVACALYLLWQLVALDRFIGWVADGRTGAPPDLPGRWSVAVAAVARLAGRHRRETAALRETIAELERVTTAIPDGAIVLTADHEIKRSNVAAARLIGVRPDDTGRRVDNLMRQPEVVALLSGEESSAQIELATDDGDRSLAMTLHRLGRDERLLLIRDVTAERSAQRARRDFVANASHELRTPLTVISGYLDAMETDATLGTNWGEPLEQMQLQARRMRQIITDLLELSRLDAAGRANSHAIDVCGLLTRVREETLAASDSAPTIEIHCQAGFRLLGAESEIHSAIANLVSNAVRYTPTDGRVDLSWRIDDDSARLSVADTGIGIEAESIPRLTERFYRVETDRVRPSDGGGTGLGLAIVKHTVQRHDGTLSVDSEPGVGSTFSCRFPLSRIQAIDSR